MEFANQIISNFASNKRKSMGDDICNTIATRLTILKLDNSFKGLIKDNSEDIAIDTLKEVVFLILKNTVESQNIDELSLNKLTCFLVQYQNHLQLKKNFQISI